MPAPIVLFTFRRLDLLTKTIMSIKNCKLVEESILHVFSDGARNEKEKQEVELIRNYLHSISGFKKIIVVERPNNFGVDYNLIEGLKEACQLYEKFIVIEDDLIFSANFLEFMNNALDYYQPFDSLITVNGFNYVKKIPKSYKYDNYITQRSWSWGWATWSDRLKDVDWDVTDFNDFLKDKQLQKEFNKGGSDLTKMLIETMTGKIRTWDVRLFYYQFRKKLYSVYPIKSKSTNLGFNENASHTFGYNRYKTSLDDSNSNSFKFCAANDINKDLNREFVKVNNLYNRILTRIYSLLKLK